MRSSTRSGPAATAGRERLEQLAGVATFDVAALARHGLLHLALLMPEPAKALAETRRVLRPDGRLSFAVFGRAEDNPWASIPAGVLTERGHMPPPSAGAPGILALGDRGRLRQLVVEAGFSDPTIDEVAFTWTYADEDEYWQYLMRVAGAISMVLGKLDETELWDVRADVLARLAPYGAADGGLALPAVCLVASTS